MATGKSEDVKLMRVRHAMEKKQLGIYPKMNILTFLQIPLIACNFSVIMYTRFHPEYYLYEPLSASSFLWCPSLLAADPFMILPSIAGLSQFFAMKQTFKNQKKLAKDGAPGMNDFMSKYLPWMPVLFIPIQAQFPCALNIYMLILTSTQVAAQMLTKTEYIRKVFDL